VDTGATQGDGPTERGATFAGERAASLRRMFPSGQRPVTPSAPTPALVAEPVLAPVERRPRRWWLVAATGVVAAAGVAAGLRYAGAWPGHPATTVAGRPPAAALTPVASQPPGSGSGPADPPRGSAGAPSSPASTKPVTATTGPAVPPPGTAEPGDGGAITGYGACETGARASFKATFTVSFTWRHVFIDSDGDGSTGYLVPSVHGGLGADYMIENGALYRSTGESWSWSAVKGSGLRTGRSGRTYTWRVPLTTLGARGGLAVIFNGSGGGPDAYTPVVPAGAC